MQRTGLRIAAALVGGLLASPPALARNPEPPEASPLARRTDTLAGQVADNLPGVAGPGDLTFLDHDGQHRFWLSGQANFIWQTHPTFASPYQGTNSLRAEREAALSGLLTVYLAYAPFRSTEIILDPEMALGGGLSSALGAAGFTNLDVVRNPSLSHAPYVGRWEVHQLVPLSADWEDNDDRGPISSLPRVPRHRLELRAGKMSTADLFDINPAGSDSHLQFMNWAVDNNGAFDYAADTRGYTYGVVVEYQGPVIELRLGEMLMPKVANGLDLDFHVGHARGENLELEVKYRHGLSHPGTVRFLVFHNLANMGSYREAVDAALAMPGSVPDITTSRRAGRSKWGAGVNVIQAVGGGVRAFARLGGNDGRNESFAYTEVDDTIELGADVDGAAWRRGGDRVGLALVSNGLSAVHRRYLELGGLGFLLGDGRLDYARENIAEQYYNLHVWRGFFLAEDVQLLAHPGYNADRGPVWVFSLRAHIEM